LKYVKRLLLKQKKRIVNDVEGSYEMMLNDTAAMRLKYMEVHSN
jgi:hypothetical protein